MAESKKSKYYGLRYVIIPLVFIGWTLLYIEYCTKAGSWFNEGGLGQEIQKPLIDRMDIIKALMPLRPAGYLPESFSIGNEDDGVLTAESIEILLWIPLNMALWMLITFPLGCLLEFIFRKWLDKASRENVLE